MSGDPMAGFALERLTANDIRWLSDTTSVRMVNALLSGDAGDLERTEFISLLAAVHCAWRRRSDPDWTVEQSSDVPIEELVALFAEGADAPKSAAPTGG